jgi:murein DD-endopeptidase MepM/ murein hydrolase activator NlpD
VASYRAVCFVTIALVFVATVAQAAQRSGSTDRTAAGRTVAHVITPRDTCASLLAGDGVPADEVLRWQRAARPIVDLVHVVAGRILRASFDARGRLMALRYDLDGEQRLAVDRGTRSALVVRREAQPVRVRAVGVRGIVGHTFQDAALRAGIPDPIVSQLVDLLSWRLDFKADMHRGDRFHVLWEQRTTLDGRPLKPGRVLAVEYLGRADSASAYLYTPDGGGAPMYVDDQGHRVDAAPLRYPLDYMHISSAFSDARFHPILLQNRPHNGVDFAAPAGTPVRAIGQATVQFAGNKSGFGNYIELDHGGDMISAYAHLQNIDRAIVPGAHVGRGQLIGWVGQSGLATGPHLHFAIFEHGEYVDPLSIEYSADLASVDPAACARVRRQMQARLRAIPQASPAAPTAPEVGSPPLAQAGRIGPITLTF